MSGKAKSNDTTFEAFQQAQNAKFENFMAQNTNIDHAQFFTTPPPQSNIKKFLELGLGNVMGGAIGYNASVIEITSGAIDIGLGSGKFASHVIVQAEGGTGGTDFLTDIQNFVYSYQDLTIQAANGNIIIVETVGSLPSNIFLGQGVSSITLNPNEQLRLRYDILAQRWTAFTGAAGGGGSGYNLIEDEGNPLTAQTTMNFTGAGVTASDGGNKTVINIPGGTTTFPIRPPVTTGLLTTGNITLNLDQTTGHYFTIGPLTGDIVITITNPPATGTAQAFRINIIKGATDFAVTFNNTLLVEPFIGTENTTTLLAGDIYDGTVFNIFTMTSTAGSGGPVEQWSTFKAVSDVNMDTFDLFDIDSLTFMGTPGTLGSLNVGFSALGSGGFRGNILNGGEFQWTEENTLLMKLSETTNKTALELFGILSSDITLFETTTGKAGTILQGTTTLQYTTTGTQHEFLVGVESVAKITASGLQMQGLNFILTPQIGFSQLGNIIQDDANGMIFDVIQTKDFTWRNGVTQGDIFATLDIEGLFLNKLFIQFTSIASPGVTGETDVGALFMDTDNNDHLSIIRNGSVIDLEAGGIPTSITDPNSSLTISDAEPQLLLSLNGTQDWLWQEDKLFVRSNTFNYVTEYFRNTGPGSNGQFITVVQYKGNDTLENPEIFVTENTAIKTATDNLEDGQYSMNVLSKGTDSPAYLLEGGSGFVNTNVLHSFFGSMLLKSDQTDEQAIFRMERNDSSTMDDDTIGVIQFRAEDSTNVDTIYGSMGMEIADNTNTSEDGRFFVSLQNGTTSLRVIEADMLTNKITLVPVPNFEYVFSNAGFESRRISTLDAATAEISLVKVDASPGDDDNIGNLNFSTDESGTVVTYSQIRGLIEDDLDSGRLEVRVRADNTGLTTGLTLTGDDNVNGRSYLNVAARINSGLRFGFDGTGSLAAKIQPLSASTVLGIVVQDNASFSVGSLGTLAAPITDTLPSGAAGANSVFGTHKGAFGFFDPGSGPSITLLVRQLDGDWAGINLLRNQLT